MYIVDDGYRIAYTPEAYALEYGSANIFEESKRKRRIAAGGLQSIWWLRRMLNPFRQPLVAFQYISHRVLRWSLTPIAMIILLAVNITLVATGAGILYTILLILQPGRMVAEPARPQEQAALYRLLLHLYEHKCLPGNGLSADSQKQWCMGKS